MTTLLELAITPAAGGARQCGPGRQEGHIYAECGFSSQGAPIERFLIDHPQAVNPAQLGLNAQGVSLIERTGVWHIVDLIGAMHYPHPADFIEEARAIGISRKIPRTADFNKLTAQSTLILIHPTGKVTNAAALAGHTQQFSCPCSKPHCAAEPCAGYHWWTAPADVGQTRHLKRTKYTVHALDVLAPTPTFTAAYIMAVPISNLSVIRNKSGQVNQDSLGRAQQSHLPVLTPDS